MTTPADAQVFVGCTGKRQFMRFNQAEKAAKRRRRIDGRAHLEAYHCRHCHAFHVGEALAYKVRKPRAVELIED